jgi:hypothetical protein
MCFGQRAENHLEFKAREVGAEAEVLADPERKMRIRITFDSEPERFIENVLVAVGRGGNKYERVALFDFLRVARSPRSRPARTATHEVAFDGRAAGDQGNSSIE